MPTCPHTSHQSPQEIREICDPISYCRESCSRTFFLCKSCGEANRTLARFCRTCGESVSCADAEREFRAPPNRDAQEEVRKFSDYGIKDTSASALHFHTGHLIVVGDSSVIVLDPHRLHEPLGILRPPADHGVRGVCVVTSATDVELLLTATHSISRRSLLNLADDGEVIYRTTGPGRTIYRPAVICGAEVYALEHEEGERSSRLIRLSDQKVVALVRGYAQPPLVTADERVFFCNEQELFLYDARRDTLLKENAPERLNAAAAPAYSGELGQAYLVGASKLWRVDVRGDSLLSVPLTAPSVGEPRVAARGDQLIMTCAQGVFVLGPSGQEHWSSSANFIKATSDGHAPLVYGDKFIFTALSRTGGSEVRVHSLNRPSDFRLISYDKSLSCTPALGLGRLFAVVSDGSSAELRVS